MLFPNELVCRYQKMDTLTAIFPYLGLHVFEEGGLQGSVSQEKVTELHF